MSRDEFEKLIEQHALALWYFAHSLYPRGAEDVVQETWLRAWQKIQNFDGRNFKGWIFKIAHNFILDKWDEEWKRKTIPLDGVSDPVDKGSSSILEEILDRERREVVAECMKKLPTEEAAVWRMRTDGSSNEEIAKDLGVKVERVHMLFFQAKNKMKLCAERKLP